MKIAQFNTFPYGGAATAAKRLHRCLRNDGIESRFLYHRNEQSAVEDPTFSQLEFGEPKYNGITGALKRRSDRRKQKDVYRLYNDHIATRPVGSETFSMAELPGPTSLDWATIDADVVHLHWISFFADYSSFFGSIPDHIPLVWTLHDMNAFTGGCHYSDNCTRFQFGCGSCHQVTQPGKGDVSSVSFGIKQKSLRRKSIVVATPSDWMRKLAETSRIWPKGTSFQTIRLGFDLDVFRPVAKREARQRLGIEGDAVLIGFGAEDINSRRKGLQHLLPALSKLNCDRTVECAVFGSGDIQASEGVSKVHHFGYVDSAERQSLIYSAADMVVVPSREDNQPQVGLEAMACGTPVVAFNAGGIPEYVRDGQTGLIAELGDETHLAERISWLANNEKTRLTMGTQARQMMEREFEIRTQSRKYLELYKMLAFQGKLTKAA